MIQQVLQKELYLPSRVTTKKLLLTNQMIKKCLKFCSKYQHWKESYWETVMYSDEAKYLMLQ
jgi:hypothetical protein